MRFFFASCWRGERRITGSGFVEDLEEDARDEVALALALVGLEAGGLSGGMVAGGAEDLSGERRTGGSSLGRGIEWESARAAFFGGLVVLAGEDSVRSRASIVSCRVPACPIPTSSRSGVPGLEVAVGKSRSSSLPCTGAVRCRFRGAFFLRFVTEPGSFPGDQDAFSARSSRSVPS